MPIRHCGQNFIIGEIYEGNCIHVIVVLMPDLDIPKL